MLFPAARNGTESVPFRVITVLLVKTHQGKRAVWYPVGQTFLPAVLAGFFLADKNVCPTVKKNAAGRRT
jgi:hypothetical protein